MAVEVANALNIHRAAVWPRIDQQHLLLRALHYRHSQLQVSGQLSGRGLLRGSKATTRVPTLPLLLLLPVVVVLALQQVQCHSLSAARSRALARRTELAVAAQSHLPTTGSGTMASCKQLR